MVYRVDTLKPKNIVLSNLFNRMCSSFFIQKRNALKSYYGRYDDVCLLSSVVTVLDPFAVPKTHFPH